MKMNIVAAVCDRRKIKQLKLTAVTDRRYSE